jgi:hypothetical protein
VSDPNKTNVTSRRRVVQHVRGGKGWLRQKNKKKNVRSSRRKFAFAGRSKNVKRSRLVKQIERGRGRKLAGLGSWAGCFEEGEIPPLYAVDVEYSTNHSLESGCIFKNSISDANNKTRTKVCFL